MNNSHSAANRTDLQARRRNGAPALLSTGAFSQLTASVAIRSSEWTNATRTSAGKGSASRTRGCADSLDKPIPSHALLERMVPLQRMASVVPHFVVTLMAFGGDRHDGKSRFEARSRCSTGSAGGTSSLNRTATRALGHWIVHDSSIA